jgi:ATP-binding protein involved in chromosome partitioning
MEALMPITVEAVRDALSTVMEPELHQDLITLDFVKDIKVQDRDVSFTIMLTTPACPLKHVLQADSEEAIRGRLPDVRRIDITFGSNVRADSRIMEKLRIPVKTVVAVGSGKGGVGKTTVSCNLAVALAMEGATVGLLDADIYGPNVPIMMGVEDLPESRDGKLVPAPAHGVQVMSMGFLIPEDQALVWRGPMIHSALQQLFTEVAWSELDYLVVDLPPGTGDAQLSLSQLVPLSGGIVVTTPQLVSVADARRAVDAYNRLSVPVLGVVENMAGEVFGSGGGEQAAKELGLGFLGRIPLDPSIRSGGDGGTPIVASDPEGQTAQAFRAMARVLAGRLSVLRFRDTAQAGSAR